MKEIFKDIKGYEGLYQISNLGRVKSLCRVDRIGHKVKEKMLKPFIKKDNGYLSVSLCNNGMKQKNIHQLVSIAFLGHEPDGFSLVVNHIDFDKTNNNVQNLEIITQRENANKKHIKSSSKYVGVCWDKPSNKWMSRIVINGKRKHLGRFSNEIEASEAYQKELKLM
jgi:hypothetical protein